MQLDEAKIQKSAKLGRVLDFPMQIVMIVFVLAAGITSIIEAFNSFNITVYFVLVGIFFLCALIGLILYLVGRHNRNYVNRQVFDYCNGITDEAIDGWCEGDTLALSLDVSLTPGSIVFSVTDGKNPPAVYDFTCALGQSSSMIIFVASCVCKTAARIKSEIAGGKVYNNVSYHMSMGENADGEKFFVKDGKPDEKELEQAAKEYEKVCKMCKK